jgi:hypothetical protein
MRNILKSWLGGAGLGTFEGEPQVFEALYDLKRIVL